MYFINPTTGNELKSDSKLRRKCIVRFYLVMFISINPA